MGNSNPGQHKTLAMTGHLKKGGLVKAKKNDSDEDDMKCGGRVMKKAGGKVHSDIAEDRALLKKAVKPSALTGKKRGGKC